MWLVAPGRAGGLCICCSVLPAQWWIWRWEVCWGRWFGSMRQEVLGAVGGKKKSTLEDGELMKCVATLSLVYLALPIIPVWLSSCVKSKVITSPHSRAASTPRCKYLCCRGSTNPALLWEERNRICWVGTGGGQKILKRIESWISAYWKPCMSSLSAELKILHTNIF